MLYNVMLILIGEVEQCHTLFKPIDVVLNEMYREHRNPTYFYQN